MRWLLVAFVSLAFPALLSAASVSPKPYVLSQAEVPQGYFLDKDNSLLLSKTTVDRASNEESRLLRRLGFMGAYLGTYLSTSPPKWRFIHSGAFVFRAAKGASELVRTWRTKVPTPFSGRGERIRLGDEAWLYKDTEGGSAVMWRHGRIVAYVRCTEMPNHRVLALTLARKQQRRIVTQTR